MTPTVNTTALILLRLSLVLTITLALILILPRLADHLPLGVSSLYLIALTGGAFMLSSLRDLARELGRRPDQRLSPH